MLERADLGVGELLATLDRLGLARNTLVVFTNDNGGEWLSRNAPLYHRKGTLWEGGIRVPLILRWPGGLPAGKTSAQAAITLDLTASILAATGTSLPEGYRPEGIDILPILRGSHRSSTVGCSGASRVRAANNTPSGPEAGSCWSTAASSSSSTVSSDPGERTDLAARHPELIVTLKRLLAGGTRMSISARSAWAGRGAAACIRN